MLVPTGAKERIDASNNRTELAGVKRWKYDDILKYTNNFNKDCLVAEFHAGKVYRGSDGNRQFAVKIWDVDVDDGRGLLTEEFAIFKAEMQKGYPEPIAFCCFFYEESDLPSAVVYNFEPKATVRDLIPKDTFSWSNRMMVALGIAETIRAYHPKYIMRYVDAAHFLCDKDYTPKFYDQSMVAGGMFRRRWVFDNVFGSGGYTDPYSLAKGDCSTKSDVFAYGLLLLSLITKMEVNTVMETRGLELGKWAVETYKSLKGPGRKRPSLVHESLLSAPYFNAVDGSTVTKLALTCMRDDPKERPDIDEVIRVLNSLHIISDYGEEIGVMDMLRRL